MPDAIQRIARAVTRAARHLTYSQGMARQLLQLASVTGGVEMMRAAQAFLHSTDTEIAALDRAADELLDPSFKDSIMATLDEKVRQLIADDKAKTQQVTDLTNQVNAANTTNQQQATRITELEQLAVDPAVVTEIDAVLASNAPAASVPGAAAPVATAPGAAPAV